MMQIFRKNKHLKTKIFIEHRMHEMAGGTGGGINAFKFIVLLCLSILDVNVIIISNVPRQTNNRSNYWGCHWPK